MIFVLGKGGVGRSTVAAGLAAGFAALGERVLVAQWAITDAISPWFGGPPTGWTPRAIAPGIDTSNFTTDAALEDYFVTHLHRRAFFRAVVANRHVRRATRAAPGLDELMFLGTMMYLTTLAREERGWAYDHVIVDPPAMGHGASLLAVPLATRALGLGGLLADECERVAAMIADPACSTAVVVSTPEELAVEETREFWPRITGELGRAPSALIVNRSVRALGELPDDPARCAWLPRAAGVDRIYMHLARRARRERSLADALGVTPVAIDDALLVDDAPTPYRTVALATEALEPVWRPA